MTRIDRVQDPAPAPPPDDVPAERPAPEAAPARNAAAPGRVAAAGAIAGEADAATMEKARSTAVRLGKFVAGHFRTYVDRMKTRGTDGEAVMKAAFGPEHPGRAQALGRRPSLAIQSITRDFFYATTLVDLTNGGFYQMSPGSIAGKVWGPLVPPEDARLTGHFSREQLGELTEVLRRSIGGG